MFCFKNAFYYLVNMPNCVNNINANCEAVEHIFFACENGTNRVIHGDCLVSLSPWPTLSFIRITVLLTVVLTVWSSHKQWVNGDVTAFKVVSFRSTYLLPTILCMVSLKTSGFQLRRMRLTSVWSSLMVSKCLPLNSAFSLGKNPKSQGAMSCSATNFTEAQLPFCFQQFRYLLHIIRSHFGSLPPSPFVVSSVLMAIQKAFVPKTDLCFAHCAIPLNSAQTLPTINWSESRLDKEFQSDTLLIALLGFGEVC